MALFSQSFLDDLKAQADIVQVVQDSVPLKRAGTSYKGLCPFHTEKTPSFHVNREKGFFHCFGCGTGGDVVKFVELQQKIGFQEAVRLLAQRFGLAVPEAEEGAGNAAAQAEREALLKIHEVAADYFRSELQGPGGSRARRQLDDRGLTAPTIDALQLGLAPPGRDQLTRYLVDRGQPIDLLVKSGLVVEREGGQSVDRFRGRLMIPICRETGAIVAFGGRALEPDQQPKYLNSPETAIYAKGRMLYGLHVTKADIRRLGYAVLVEGYFDFAQVWQAGVLGVVASCGTAVTDAQARLLRRFTTKVILSFDPDAAGQGASARSGELLISEGLQVNVAVLPAGEDPDTCVRRHGGTQYMEKLRTSQPYLEYVLDRAAAARDFSRSDHRRAFLNDMLAVAARIPDAATRDQFGDRLAHKARITEDVVRAEIRKAAVARRTRVSERELASLGRITVAERGLIWALLHEPASALHALAQLEDADLDELATRPILQAARGLLDWPPDRVPATLMERLTKDEGELVEGIGADGAPPATILTECPEALRQLRRAREHATIQEEIARQQQLGPGGDDEAVNALLRRKLDQIRALES